MGQCIQTVAEVVIEESTEVHQPNSTTSVVRLSQVDPEAVEDVMLKGQTVDFKLVKVYDGDTIHGIIMVGNSPVKMSFRIMGIDTPEIKAGAERLPEEKIAGLKAKAFVENAIKSGARIKIEDWDKYGGRMLCHVILANGRDLSDVMIESGYAKIYNGEKKSKWTPERLSIILSKP